MQLFVAIFSNPFMVMGVVITIVLCGFIGLWYWMTRRLRGFYGALEKKVAERTRDLTQEHDRMQGIIMAMGEGLILVDARGKIIMMNPAAERLLKVTMTTMRGTAAESLCQTFIQGKEKPKANQCPVLVALKEGAVVTVEMQDDVYFAASDDSMFPVTVVATPLKGKTKGAVMVFRDITREKQLDQSRTEFVSIASHQLRTPLTAMRWFLETLVDGDAGDLTPKQKDLANEAYAASGRLIETLELLLKLARLESGRVRIAPAPISIVELAQTVVAELKPDWSAKKLVVSVSADPKMTKTTIAIDQDMARQVLLNLVSNAIRYTGEKKRIKIWFTLDVKKKQLIGTVEDQGIGIPLDEQGMIFTRFYRASNAVRAIPDGSGLGLSLVKMIVALWGGTVSFVSQEGKGSTFMFTIPLVGMRQKAGSVVLGSVIK